jgi:ABC-type sugar transport system substrate-binding protein
MASVLIPLARLTALAAPFAVTACTGKEAGGADTGAFVVGFSQMESDNPWRIAQTKSLRAPE